MHASDILYCCPTSEKATLYFIYEILSWDAPVYKLRGCCFIHLLYSSVNNYIQIRKLFKLNQWLSVNQWNSSLKQWQHQHIDFFVLKNRKALFLLGGYNESSMCVSYNNSASSWSEKIQVKQNSQIGYLWVQGYTICDRTVCSKLHFIFKAYQ